MITYPVLTKPVKIGVTAPSAGLHFDQYSLLERAVERMNQKGYQVEIGNTCWTQFKGKSAPAKVRAAELNLMLQDETIQFIFPPWGGELLVEILEYVDFDIKKPKWILGYSDTSVLLLAMTLKNGLATAHGVNLVDLRGERSDPTTAMWEEVLHTKQGEEVIQYPSERYQLYCQHNYETEWIYHLTEPTK